MITSLRVHGQHAGTDESKKSVQATGIFDLLFSRGPEALKPPLDGLAHAFPVPGFLGED